MYSLLISLTISENEVHQWSQDAEAVERSPMNKEKLTKKQSLSLLLKRKFDLNAKLDHASTLRLTDDEITSYKVELIKISAQSTKRMLSLKVDWKEPSDPNYLSELTKAVEIKRVDLLHKLRLQNAERKWNASLHAKYSDGQSIAKRIAAKGVKICRGMKKLVTEYNSYADVPGVCPSITYQSVITDASVAVGEAAKAKMIQYYRIRVRSCEEEALVKTEMANVLNHFKTQIQLLSSKEQQLHRLHEKAYIRFHIIDLSSILVYFSDRFSKYIPVPDLQTTFSNIMQGIKVYSMQDDALYESADDIEDEEE